MKKAIFAALAASMMMIASTAFALEANTSAGYKPHPADEGKTLAEDKPSPPAADKKAPESPPPAADTLVTAPPAPVSAEPPKPAETTAVDAKKLSDDGTSGLIWDPRVQAWMPDTRPK